MRKRRKPLPTIAILIGLAWVFLCLYVFLYGKIIAIGYRLDKSKKSYEEINMLNKNYKAEILIHSSPEYLLRITKNAGIELINPSEWCYVDITIENAKRNRNDKVEASDK